MHGARDQGLGAKGCGLLGPGRLTLRLAEAVGPQGEVLTMDIKDGSMPENNLMIFSGWLAAISVAVVGFALYVVMVNAATWSQIGRTFLPNAMWLALIFWMVPALPGLGLGVMVLVSARAQGFQDAYQIGNLIVLPVVFLAVSQVAGVISFTLILVFLLGLIIWLLDGLLI